jgi:hypothetical protein
MASQLNHVGTISDFRKIIPSGINSAGAPMKIMGQKNEETDRRKMKRRTVCILYPFENAY